MDIYEEIAVWRRTREGGAVRLTGFKSVGSGLVVFTSANHLWLDPDDIGSSVDPLGLSGLIEEFLDIPPTSSDRWKPTISEAAEDFLHRIDFS
jgi:hypothetical protein